MSKKNKRAKSQKAENHKSINTKKLGYITVTVIVMLILAGMVFYFFPRQPPQPKAAIIDQLNSSQLTDDARYRNQTFVEIARNLLYERFSQVDYYSDNATVDQYKLLASLGYKLIIWRAHSALALESNFVAISSSEKYGSKNYDQYLESGLLILGNVSDNINYYFEITPKFIVECMNGRFEDTVIILMSCNGLKSDYYKTAETFIEKGVKAFISWDGWIASSDNDAGATLLLQHLISENKTIGAAVDEIPTYFSSFGVSTLKYYPETSDVANYHIPNYKQNTLSANATFAAITDLRKNFRVKLGY
jgi:hypothetical protein